MMYSRAMNSGWVKSGGEMYGVLEFRFNIYQKQIPGLLVRNKKLNVYLFNFCLSSRAV